VLGTARIARDRVLPGMKKSASIEIRAIASRDEARARATADALGIPKAYGSYEALLADPEIEAVYNPLPNHLHVPLTLEAAAAGKHVLCEKPIALTADEAAALRATAGKVLVAEAFMVRFHPQWLRAREIVREGRNAPQGATTRLLIDDCSSLEGTGIVTETIAESDQYQLQGEAFSRAVRGEIALPHGIEDAILNMRVIDALFRSEQSGRWEDVGRG
jgi:predicted dehydrogenase